MADSFLTADDLQELTGYVRPSAQRRWLATQGYRFDVRADGRPAVLRAQIEQLRSVDEWAFREANHPSVPTDVLTLDAIRALPLVEDAGPRGNEDYPGLYFLFDGGKLVYIGMSRQVVNRLYHHECARTYRRDHKQWQTARALYCSKNGLAEAERRHIQAHAPRYNVQGL